MSVAVHHGDCREIVPALGCQVDSIVTDPPYHLTSTLARFGNIDIGADTATSRRLRKKGDGAARLAHGFMNQQWDGGNISFDAETWRIIGAALRPGGFLLAFGGTRTHHRLACAIEDAGFVIQDCLMWLFGTGFPKRRDALKPAYEPIVMAYKPGGKRALSINECRIGTGEDKGEWPITERRRADKGWGMSPIETNSAGRWPANILHDGSDEVVGMFPQAGGGFGKSGGSPDGNGIYNKGFPRGNMEIVGYGDSGSAARFFYSSKAGAQDRWGSRHPTVKPVELMKWLVALVTPQGGTVLDCFAGSGTTGVAALATGRNAILIEREDQYIADIRERMAFYEGAGAHSVQAINRNRTVDHGPLFAGEATS